MFTIKEKDRTRHVYIPGTTQLGKSTLIYWMALQNIAKGRGVCVIDGKGDFMEKFLFRLIPDNIHPDFIPKIEARLNDIIYLDVETPIAIDFMSCKGEREKERLIGELKFLLLKTVDAAHMPVIDTNLTNCLYTLFDYNDNPDVKPDRRATFLDIYRFFAPEHFDRRREEILSKLTHRGLLTQWRKAWPNAQDCARITTRVNSFDKSKTLTKIFDAPEPKLNILEAMNQRKIILLNIGPVDEIQKIYGTLILSKIRQAAFRRSQLLEDEKPENYYLYCDEFQEYQTSDFPKMIAQAGGLGLCLTLANQWMGQMEAPVCDAVRTISTFIIFHLDPRDARDLKDHLGQEAKPTPEERKRDLLLAQWERLQIDLDLLRRQHPGPPQYSSTDTYIKFLKLGLEIQTIEKDLSYLPRPRIMPPEVSDIPMLRVGQTIFKRADGTVHRMNTPKPPVFSRRTYADYIRNRTLANYSCESLKVSYELEDALKSTAAATEKDGGAPDTRDPKRTAHKKQKTNP
jgi:hypothetical protein